MSVLHFKWQVFRKALRPMRKSGTVPDFYSRVLNRRNGSGNLGDGLKNGGKNVFRSWSWFCRIQGSAEPGPALRRGKGCPALPYLNADGGPDGRPGGPGKPVSPVPRVPVGQARMHLPQERQASMFISGPLSFRGYSLLRAGIHAGFTL